MEPWQKQICSELTLMVRHKVSPQQSYEIIRQKSCAGFRTMNQGLLQTRATKPNVLERQVSYVAGAICSAACGLLTTP